MRPLPILQRRRAALVSVTGHCLLASLLTLLSVGKRPPAAESPLIMAELVPTLEAAPEPPAAEIPAAAAEAAPTAEPPEHAEPRQAAGSPPEVVPLEPPSDETEPSVVQSPADPPPVERPSEAPLRERLAEVAPAPAAPATEPPAADTSIAGTEQRIADLGAPAADAGEPGRALASHEERAVLRRLSSWTGRIDAEEPSATLTWREAGQEFKAVLTRLPTTSSMGMEQLQVELTTEREGERLVTDLRMNRLAFSSFAQFIDRWDPDVQIHDDLIDGRFHSNSEIRVSRERGVRPVFNGKVTVAGGDIRTDGVGFLNRRAMFPAGIETSVRRIALPPRAAAFDDDTVPADRMLRVAEDSRLTFHGDGTFEAETLSREAASTRAELGDEPFYVIGEEDAELHVRGTVNGKVLVYSRDRIVIVGNVRYAHDPRAVGADDYLGLVAERTVEIAEPDVTGAGDLEVHASIYARNRFAVRDYRSRRSGTLIVYGSVTAGSVSATEPRFATRIEFDDRLATMRAPGFPLSDRYELDTMSGEWRVVERP